MAGHSGRGRKRRKGAERGGKGRKGNEGWWRKKNEGRKNGALENVCMETSSHVLFESHAKNKIKFSDHDIKKHAHLLY